MPSLKDLRNRIGSVKATRKITKAMQMVAAAKLRRAQEAATAARPYAERMDRVLANLNASVSNRAGASPLLVGTGKDQVAPADRHDRRARPVRRLQLQHRPPRARRCRSGCARPARRSRSCAVGRKGYGCTAARLGSPDRRPRRPQGRQAGGLRQRARTSPTRCCALFEAGEFDVCHALFLRVQVGDRAEADRAAADPRSSCPSQSAPTAPARPQAVYEYEPERERDPELPAAAQHRRRRSSAACSRTPPPSRARA